MSKTQVIVGVERRRRFTDEDKMRIVSEIADTSLSAVSRKYNIAMSALSLWRKKFLPKAFALVEVSKDFGSSTLYPSSAKVVDENPLLPIRVLLPKNIVVEFPLAVDLKAIAQFVRAWEG